MMSTRVSRWVALGATVALVLVAWYVLAPRQLGGRNSYVTTTGTSMEPLLHAGDLAVVRPQDRYAVGDVVAYENAELERVVLHRVVAFEAGRYTFQGDANDWIDGYRPTPSEILGTMVLRIPAVGSRLSAVRTSLGVSAVAALATVTVVGGRRRLRRGRRDPAEGNGENRHRGRARLAPRAASSAAVLGAASAITAVVAATIAVVAFALPSTAAEHRDVPFEETGAFTYSATAGPNAADVYGRPAVVTGDPIYRRLTNEVRVGFAYRFESDYAFIGGGQARLVAVISDSSGWIRSLELSPPREFRGPAVELVGSIDLGRIGAMIGRVERLTGVDRAVYRLAVRPEIALTGTLAHREVHRAFAPELAFQLDPLQLQLVAEAGAVDALEQVDPRRGGLVTSEVVRPRSVRVAGVDLGLRVLRVASLTALTFGVLGLALFALLRSRAARRGEPAWIQARYARWLVPVQTAPSPGRVVDVDSFDSLRRLAEHYGHLVLHHASTGWHAYLVEEHDVTYRYTAAAGRRG